MWRGELTLRHPQPLPVHQRARAGDAVPRGGRPRGADADEHAELWAAVTDCVRAIKAAYRPTALNVGMNLGAAAGAGVPGHLHVHVHAALGRATRTS